MFTLRIILFICIQFRIEIAGEPGDSADGLRGAKTPRESERRTSSIEVWRTGFVLVANIEASKQIFLDATLFAKGSELVRLIVVFLFYEG